MGNGTGAVEAVGIDAGFWQDRKVLVTGHTGFKGAWLTLWLRSLGAQVVGYALPPPTRPSLFEAARAGDGITSITGDVRDPAHLGRVVAAHRPEVVFHLAAQALVREGYADPVTTYATNVLGTVHLLEALRQAGCARAVINVTSDKCYENREWIWPYRENEPLGGHDPYSSSKACAELVGSAYRDAFLAASGTALASARAGNVIGGGDWARDRLVPDLVRAFIEGTPAIIRYPDAVRPWQHVLEPLDGYLLLAQALWRDGRDFAEAWNFGPAEAEARPVSWLAECAVAAWGPGGAWQADATAHPHEARLLRLDSSKARIRLGWQSRWHMEAAVGRTIAWYKAHAAGEDMRAFTQRQIADYTEGR